MLKEVYLDALRNREKKVSRIRDANHHKIVSEALSRWISYLPEPVRCTSAGVDSSWNQRAFQGLNLYVVDAVAVTNTNEILARDFEVDLAESARRELLETKAMTMEAKMAKAAAEIKAADVICVDGSLIARTNVRRKKERGDVIAAAAAAAADDSSDLARVKEYDSSVFISKSSESRAQFGQMGSRAGDIYYYNQASNHGAGFSMPEEAGEGGGRGMVGHPGSGFTRVFEVYARLRDHTPMLRIEVMNSTTSVQEMKSLLNKLSYRSVGGYPYCLKLAHDNCKVSNEDIDKLVSIFSLQHEQGARGALEDNGK